MVGRGEHRTTFTGCGRNLKSGIQCELCGHWYHRSGSMKAQEAEREVKP
jgi:hypothetical protein